MPDPPDEFMTVAEVATTLKVNQQTVRNWIDAGTLPAVRIGRRVRIKRSDFDRVVEANYSGPTPAPVAGIWDGEIPPPETTGGDVPPLGSDD
jgi:excisionase family DNA binding protein